MPMKDAERIESATRKRSPSCEGQREHLSCFENYAEWNVTLCLPYSHLVNSVNKCSFHLQITLNLSLSESLLHQMYCLILFISHSCCNVMVLTSWNHQLFHLMFFILNLYFMWNVLKLWTLNTFITFIYVYRVWFHVASCWIKWLNTTTLEGWLMPVSP